MLRRSRRSLARRERFLRTPGTDLPYRGTRPSGGWRTYLRRNHGLALQPLPGRGCSLSPPTRGSQKALTPGFHVVPLSSSFLVFVTYAILFFAIKHTHPLSPEPWGLAQRALDASLVRRKPLIVR